MTVAVVRTVVDVRCPAAVAVDTVVVSDCFVVVVLAAWVSVVVCAVGACATSNSVLNGAHAFIVVDGSPGSLILKIGASESRIILSPAASASPRVGVEIDEVVVPAAKHNGAEAAVSTKTPRLT